MNLTQIMLEILSRKYVLLIAGLLVDKLILDASALTNMHIKVPEAVRTGASVTLSCDYDLESAALYTIKWFRNEEEFYRYVPKESPPSQVFPVPHLTVDVSKSNWKDVTLTSVEKVTSGEFKCEVTADAPLFHTDHRVSHLVVAEVPLDGPALSNDLTKVAPGATIKANCTTPASFPKMNVTWFLNDVEIRPSYGVRIENSIVHFDALPDLETVHSAVSIRATPDLFKNGKLKLRCSATMFALYVSSKEAEIHEDAPQLALIMVPLDHSSRGSSSSLGHYRLEFLVIVYLLSSYYTPG